MAIREGCYLVSEMLDRIKEMKNLRSDYALAKLLEARVQVISNYRNGRSLPDEKMAKRIADEIGLPWGYVLTCIAAERATRSENDALANTWRDMAEKIGVKLCVALMAATGAGAIAPPPAQAAGTLHNRISHAQSEPVIHIVRTRRRRKSSLQDAAGAAIEIAAATLGIKQHRCL